MLFQLVQIYVILTDFAVREMKIYKTAAFFMSNEKKMLLKYTNFAKMR